jgi:hypothetical protein
MLPGIKGRGEAGIPKILTGGWGTIGTTGFKGGTISGDTFSVIAKMNLTLDMLLY